MLRGPAREIGFCVSLGLGISLLQWWPVLQRPAATGFGDWQMIHHNWEAAYVTLSRFGEWPLWDPFHCGGVPILGNPESQLYSPWFLLSFAFGTVIAVKLMLIGQIAAGAAGMYWLAYRRYQLRPAAAAVAAIAWSCSGCFVWDGAGGHATFLSFAYAPWLSYFVHRSARMWTDAAAVAALLLLCLLAGGTYPLPFFAIWLSFELGLRAVERRSVTSSLRFAAVSGTLLGACGAIRFVPIWLTLQAHPRKVPNTDALSLTDVWTMLTARSHSWRVAGHPFVWPEYGSYVGVAVVVLAAFGSLVAVTRQRWHLLAALSLYAALMCGDLGEYAPFSLLHRLPIYDSLRVPSRFAIFVTFFVALLAAHAIDAMLCALRRPRLANVLGTLAAASICSDLLVASWPTVKLWREPPLSTAAPAAEFHLVARDYYAWYASYPRLNLGTPACYVGGMKWPVSRGLWLGAKPQVRVSDHVNEVRDPVRDWTWTPNRISATVSLETPANVLFNQNFARGFVSNIGHPKAADGLLALDLPAGEHTIELRYRPREFVPSAAVSLAGLVAMLWLLLGRRRPALQRSGHAK